MLPVVQRDAATVVDSAGRGPVRVMVVDDSAIVRGMVTQILESDPAVTVAASVGNGALAVERLSRARDIDVIVLDIEMPVMDGLAALPKLLAIDPTVQVVMASTLTQRNAHVSLQALESGAADYVPKPTSRQLGSNDDFRREVLAKVKTLGAVRRRRFAGSGVAAARSAAIKPRVASGSGETITSTGAPAKIALRPTQRFHPDIIAIGCSTGGPQALAVVMNGLKAGGLTQPILITQHMPPTFTTILAEHLQRLSSIECAEAKSGEPLRGGRIYVAPGNYHMMVEAAGGGLRLRLVQDPPENFCRPSVDPMLRSVARCFPRKALAVMLTGMGSDGLAGSRDVVEAGGNLVAQDQASSVVWGMPGAVATAGLCCAVEPLERIAATILGLAKGVSGR
jgi:two-component system, chemotaxis family, protein-glutamate methylesterase/glutaminase